MTFFKINFVCYVTQVDYTREIHIAFSAYDMCSNLANFMRFKVSTSISSIRSRVSLLI